MFSASHNQVDVLIVGAGPAGLTAAIELLRRGISCRIVEQQDQPTLSSRALSTHARTLELFMMMGIYDSVRAQAQPVNGSEIYEDGASLGHFDLRLQPYQTPVDATLFIEQSQTERIMRDRVTALGGQVEFGMELVSFTQSPEEGVQATLRNTLFQYPQSGSQMHTQHGSPPSLNSIPTIPNTFGENTPGAEEQVSASWLLGCDGAHSLVRKQLEIAFTGSEDETWLVVDALVEWQEMARNRMHMFRSPENIVMAFPFPEEHKWRLLDTQVPATIDERTVAEQFSRKISQTLKRPVTVQPPSWLARFTIQQGIAATMRSGRCFLAGDAAHVHSPASGQGLNTGIQDAYNLGWKLALVIQGHAHESLLDAYSEERLPIAQRRLRSALTSTRLVSTRNPLIKHGGKAFRLAMQIKPLQQTASTRITQEITGLDIRYPHSSSVSEDWIGPRHVLRQEGIKGLQIVAEQLFEETVAKGPDAGARVPDVAIELLTNTPDPTPAHLFDLLQKNTHYTLLIFTGKYASDEIYRAQYEVATTVQRLYPESISVVLVTPSRIVAQQFAGLEAIILDPRLTVHRSFGLSDNGLYLIRPDGYVGYRNQPTLPAAILRYLEHILTTHHPEQEEKTVPYTYGS